MAGYRNSLRSKMRLSSQRSEKTFVPIEHRKVSDDGVEYSVTELVEMNVSDSAIVNQIPTSEQYKLADLLKAGVPLQEINTAGLIDGDIPSFDIDKAFNDLKAVVEPKN